MHLFCRRLNLCGAGVTFVLASLAASPGARPYYVSAGVSGSGTGTFADPFRTIQQAASVIVAGDTCYIRAGTYYETVRPANSGTSASSQIVFTAYQSENVVVHGGRIVDPAAWTVHSGNIYKATGVASPREVFVNREYMLQARHPNMPYYPGKGFVMLKQFTNTANAPTVSDWSGAKILEGSAGSWVSDIRSVSSYTESVSGILIGPLGLLDAPGEWAYSGTTLYLWPVGNANPRTSGILVETAASEFAIDLSSRNYVTLLRITVFGAGINMNSATNCTIDGCKVFYHGSIFLTDGRLKGFTRDGPTTFSAKGKGVVVGGSRNTVRNCEIAHSWGDGVTMYGADHVLENNWIYDCDWSGTDCAPLTMSGDRHSVRYNTMHDGGRGVLVHRSTGSSRIEYNDLFGAGWMRFDLGTTYTFNTDGKGTVLAYNWVHQNYALQGSAGIYLDNGSDNHVVHHNMIWAFAARANFAGLGWNLSAINHKIYNNGFYNIPRTPTIREAQNWQNCDYVNNLIPFADSGHSQSVTISNNIGDPHPGYNDPEFGDFTLKPTSVAVNAGRVQTPYTDGYSGSAPDVGPYEYGAAPWVAGADFARRLWMPIRVPGALSRFGWTVSSTSNSVFATMAIDGRKDTRWDTRTLTNTDQQTSQTFMVDMQQPMVFDRVLLFASAAPRDCYPRSYEVYVSSDGNYGSPIATGAGADSVTVISFAPQNKQYIRIVQKPGTGSAWGIDELVVAHGGAISTTMPQPGVAAPDQISRVLVYMLDGRLVRMLDLTAHPMDLKRVDCPLITGVYAVGFESRDGRTRSRTMAIGRHVSLRMLLTVAGL